MKKKEPYSLQLEFRKGGEHPGPDIAIISIRTSSTDHISGGHLTPYCVSLAEIDHEIDRLHAELDGIRERARERFAGVNEPRS